MKLINLFEYLTVRACCKFKNDGGQWFVTERSVRKNKRYLMIKELQSLDITQSRARSLDMKYYLVTGGLPSVTKSYNKRKYRDMDTHCIIPWPYVCRTHMFDLQHDLREKIIGT